jgi:hypothetical protein
MISFDINTLQFIQKIMNFCIFSLFPVVMDFRVGKVVQTFPFIL